MKYGELLYSLPTVSSKVAASVAIKRIQKIAEHDERLLLWLLQPSNVLLLADLRSESPYNESLVLKELGLFNILRQELKKLDIYYIDEATRYDDPTLDTWSLVNMPCMQNLALQYECLRDIFISPLPIESSLEYIEWVYVIEKQLNNLMATDKLPKTWLNNPDSAHDLRFGMLLGYPGEAISSLVWSDLYSSDKKGTYTQFIISDNDIAYAMVAFDLYDKKPHESTVATIKLWKHTLQLVYEHFGTFKENSMKPQLNETYNLLVNLEKNNQL